MSTSTFRAGVMVEIDERSYVLLRTIANDRWQLEDCRNRGIHERTLIELQGLYENGRLVFFKPIQKNQFSVEKVALRHLDSIPDEVKVRRAYVKATRDLPSTDAIMRPVINELWEKLRQPEISPHPITVMRWRKRYFEADSDILSLVSNVESRGNRTSRYPSEINEFVNAAIESEFLTMERKSIAHTVEQAQIAVKAENKLRPSSLQLPLPTRRVVTARIQRIPAYDRYLARHGRAAAEVKFRAVLGHRTTKLPLERAEIDHTPLDLFVVDDETFVPLGRPYLTTCIDDHTRSILGFHIGFQPPSYLTVAKCLKHAFLPKTGLRAAHPEIKNEWVQHGIMRELVVDNGAEFHSDSLELACERMGIEMHYAPRKKGAFKGKIERFQGTMNRSLAHSTPGTTFSNIFEREDYDPTKQAVIRYSTLKKMALMWIVDYYHQKPHRGLDREKPSKAWTTRIDPCDIRLPDNPAHLDAIMGRPETRRLTHKGIELDGLFYNAAELTELRRQHADVFDVQIRIDDENLGSIYVLSPNKTHIFQVPALKSEYAKNLTRWQHKICKRYARQNLGLDTDDSWLDAKERIANLIAGEMNAKLKKGKKISSRAARYLEDEARRLVAVKDVEIKKSTDLVMDERQHTGDGILPQVSRTNGAEQYASLPTTKIPKKFKIEHRDRSRSAIEEEGK